MKFILFILLICPNFVLACVSNLEREIQDGIELQKLEAEYIPIIFNESTYVIIGRVLGITDTQKGAEYSVEVELLEVLKGIEKSKKMIVSVPAFSEDIIVSGRRCYGGLDKSDVYNKELTFLNIGYKYLLYLKGGNVIRSNEFIESLDAITAEEEVFRLTKEN